MKTDIRARLLLLTLAPAALTAGVLATYLITTRIQDFEKSLRERSQTIANQLAFACADGVASGNKEVLNALARSAFQEADVKAVLIQDASGNRLVSLGKDNSVAPAVPASPYCLSKPRSTAIRWRFMVVRPRLLPLAGLAWQSPATGC